MIVRDFEYRSAVVHGVIDEQPNSCVGELDVLGDVFNDRRGERLRAIGILLLFLAFDARVAGLLKCGKRGQVEDDFNEIPHHGVVVVNPTEEVDPILVIVTTGHCSKLEVLVLQLDFVPKIVTNAVDPYVLNEVDVVIAHAFPGMQTRVLASKQQQILLSKSHHFMPRSTFGHVGGNESFHEDLAGEIPGGCADCDLIEIIEVLFLVVHIAVSATEEVKTGVVVCDGGVEACIDLIVVVSLAFGPIFGVEVVEVEGVVDLYFVGVESSVEEEPVLLEEGQKSRLSRSWHISFLIQTCPF